MNQLKRILFDEYGGFADKRIKKLERSSTFIVDDRSDSDVGADRKLYSYFCMVFAGVQSETVIQLSLRGNIPMGASVEQWISAHKCKSKLDGCEHCLSFMVEKGSQFMLGELANAFDKIVAPGAPRYSVPNYKYVCPRTAKSLRRLERVLDGVWRS